MERIIPFSEPYERDFVLWAEAQLCALAEGSLSMLDIDHLTEELEDMVSCHKHALRSRLRVIIMHLLKWEFQPAMRTPSWRVTLETQRQGIELLLKRSPSLGNLVLSYADDEYPRAVRLAVLETGMQPAAFPAALPYTRQQLLDPDFVP